MSVALIFVSQRKVFNAVLHKIYRRTVPTIVQHTKQTHCLRHYGDSKSSSATLNKNCTNESGNVESINLNLGELNKSGLTTISEGFGLKWKRFAPLNELLKGHRKGELTILTDQSGIDKTTFMSEYSLDLCMQGLPTLWTGFEIPDFKLMGTMLLQFSKCIPHAVSASEKWSMFRKIPMFIHSFQDMDYFEEMLEVMSDAVRFNNVRHIVIDDLEFVLGMGDCSIIVDELQREDYVISAFRDFATQMDCHITLVMYPRKESDLSETENMLTSEAAQEADNVLILQATKSRQYLKLTKNRFDGQTGCILLEFDQDNGTYTMRKMKEF